MAAPEPQHDGKTFKVGDVVTYEGQQWTIEKEYAPGVFLLGTVEAFCDMVAAHELGEYGPAPSLPQS